MLHTRAALVDTVASVQGSDGIVNADWEVLNYLFTKIYDILYSAFTKQVGNVAFILAYLLNSTSRSCPEVWDTQFPFLHNINDTVPPSEACLSIHINWSLVQVHQLSSLRLSQSSTSISGARSKAHTEFMFNVEKWPVQESGGAFLAKKPHFSTKIDNLQSSRKSAGVHLPVLLILGRRQSH